MTKSQSAFSDSDLKSSNFKNSKLERSDLSGSAAKGAAIKGRGALSNPHNRYHKEVSEFIEQEVVQRGPPKTEYREVNAQSIIASNRSPDVPFDASINPYQGCEHGCIYCYARPTHAYHDLSPGIDFETRIQCKTNAAELLRNTLEKKNYRCRPITIGANTDPYQPAEKELKITRQLLHILLDCQHPVSLITKGSLITRDLDLLAPLAAKGLCSVAISITTLNDALKRQLEPRASSGKSRLATVRALSDAGIPVTLLFAPVIPALNDQEMETIVSQAQQHGAHDAAYILLRLPLEISELFQQWLQTHYPLRADHVMSILRQSRGGQDNDARFGHRMRGEGVFAELLSQRFKVACRAAGLERREAPNLRCDLFRPPAHPGGQLTLFDTQDSNR